jgi:predicted GNAT family acetyltransferase
MEHEVINRILTKLLKKEYPESGISEVLTTREPDYMSYYIDKERSKYNVFIVFRDENSIDYYRDNDEDWDEMKTYIKVTMRGMGINQKINIYKESEEEP